MLEPGSLRILTTRTVVRTVDVRPRVVPLPMQEIPTADGVTVKVTATATATATARVTDPVAFLTGSQEPLGALYLAVQLALRDVVGATTVDELVQRRSLGEALLGALRLDGALGLAVDAVELRDVVLPSELKRARAGALLARAEGQAALERARGESAALRNLANAARLAADNPVLLQLRLLQQLGSTAHTVVLASDAVPPLRAARG